MVDNQHKQITGYRDLTQEEIALMNEIKAKANEVGAIIEKVAVTQGIDGRWLAIGKTSLQSGFMALTRSVARPESF